MEIAPDSPIHDVSTTVQTTPDIAVAKTIEMRQNLDEKKHSAPDIVEVNSEQVHSPPRSFRSFHNSRHVLLKFLKFMGPGAVISVAYIDPDNFQTAISAGAQFKYKLLFMILLSNIIAIYLQVSS
jgi:metal iron transporter